ncbi:MAG: hypothetical protein ILA52_02800 [Alphaproteobacteria bacterium]|nr:hypothetical protein [Alphaproteobacteria bacterium]MBP1532407.1 hypothetical protein [Alphaproteobacteria bacterium]
MVEQTVQEDPDVIEGQKIAKKLLKTYLFIGAACAVGAVVSGPIGVSAGVGIGAALGCVAAGYVAIGAVNVCYDLVRYAKNKAQNLIFKSKSGITKFKNTQKSLAQQYEHYEEVFARMRQKQVAQQATQNAGAGQRTESAMERNYQVQSIDDAKKTVNGKVLSKKTKIAEPAKKIETRAFEFNGFTQPQGGRKL